MDTFELIIAFSLVIIASFFFNIIAKKTKIPSVLMLMVLGVALQGFISTTEQTQLGNILPILGNVGLIMIVLEAALDLELAREKFEVLFKSFMVALLALVASSFSIAIVLQLLITHMLNGDPSFMQSLVYAIPLSIMSSAIIIPSVLALGKNKREFMIYESTFSDILGIMFFYFLVGSGDADSAQEVTLSIFGSIVITLILAAIVSYSLVFIFQKLRSQVKLFLIIAVLMLMYALGKQLHLSSLVIILAFGLVLNNTNVFFWGKLNKYVNEKSVKPIMHDFHILTLETAFVVRTFFFVIFGVSISLSSLVDWKVAVVSLSIIALLYIMRYVFLKLFLKRDLMPQLLLAPRGLITILLYFSILSEHPEYIIPEFDAGILLYTILITSIIMAVGLITNRGKKVKDVFITNIRGNIQEIKELPKSVVSELQKDYNKKGIDIDLQKEIEKDNERRQKTDETTDSKKDDQ